jgi:hypothetical protein
MSIPNAALISDLEETFQKVLSSLRQVSSSQSITSFIPSKHGPAAPSINDTGNSRKKPRNTGYVYNSYQECPIFSG